MFTKNNIVGLFICDIDGSVMNESLLTMLTKDATCVIITVKVRKKCDLKHSGGRWGLWGFAVRKFAP